MAAIDPDDQDSTIGTEDSASSTASLTSSILHYRTINGRTYHSESHHAKYYGANDALQNSVLDIAHHAFTLVLDGKLNLAPIDPDIEKALDIGTGTGLWVIDFADEHPNTKVIGTDLSAIQPVFVPPNAEFQIDDFRESWTFEPNSIDFVHLRWMAGTFTDGFALAREAFEVLKPGGWIEWFDGDVDIYSDDNSVTPETATGQWGKVFKEGLPNIGIKGGSVDIVNENLQQRAFAAAGFTNIQYRDYKIAISEWPKDPRQKEIGLCWRAIVDGDAVGLMSRIALAAGWTNTEITVYAAKYKKELRELKIHPYFLGRVAWAQKPLTAGSPAGVSAGGSSAASPVGSPPVGSPAPVSARSPTGSPPAGSPAPASSSKSPAPIHSPRSPRPTE